MLAGNDCRRLQLARLREQFFPFEKSRKIPLPDWLVLDIESRTTARHISARLPAAVMRNGTVLSCMRHPRWRGLKFRL